MHKVLPKSEGLRERKRRETLQRIAEVGLEFFVAKGYEATTLDEIAAAAGISRRTFFHYFKSKDDILLTYISSRDHELKALVLENSFAGAPLDIARNSLMQFVSRPQESQMIMAARLIRANEALRTRSHGRFLEFERVIYSGLCELWPGREHCDRMQLVAMISIGALRLAVEKWFEQNGKQPLAKYVRDAFKRLKSLTDLASDSHS
jgi:AcrR family transcriptional regulator